MTSKPLGKPISRVEVTHISPHGLSILVGDREYHLPFTNYPWFQRASTAQIRRVEMLHGHHLHWPELDIDLELESLEHPEAYPLKARM
ncbi:MAG: DUF2442 domain-containing protein [Deltaproteobacteria bacterium]|nr:DUF2442 domain-containing protein [Deltaproteobacteria bacterium]